MKVCVCEYVCVCVCVLCVCVNQSSCGFDSLLFTLISLFLVLLTTETSFSFFPNGSFPPSLFCSELDWRVCLVNESCTAAPLHSKYNKLRRFTATCQNFVWSASAVPHQRVKKRRSHVWFTAPPRDKSSIEGWKLNENVKTNVPFLLIDRWIKLWSGLVCFVLISGVQTLYFTEHVTLRMSSSATSVVQQHL